MHVSLGDQVVSFNNVNSSSRHRALSTCPYTPLDCTSRKAWHHMPTRPIHSGLEPAKGPTCPRADGLGKHVASTGDGLIARPLTV